MSVALSNRFQGGRRVPAGRAATCAPGSVRGAGAAGCVASAPRFPAASLSPPGGKAFGLLKAQQERRLAEINRVSRGTACEAPSLPPPAPPAPPAAAPARACRLRPQVGLLHLPARRLGLRVVTPGLGAGAGPGAGAGRDRGSRRPARTCAGVLAPEGTPRPALSAPPKAPAVGSPWPLSSGEVRGLSLQLFETCSFVPVPVNFFKELLRAADWHTMGCLRWPNGLVDPRRRGRWQGLKMGEAQRQPSQAFSGFRFWRPGSVPALRSSARDHT